MQELKEKLFDFWAQELKTKKMVMPSKIMDLANELQTTPEALESLIRDLQSPDGGINQRGDFLEPSCDLLEKLKERKR
jgi:hypothetical protein